jgi:uncharacterized protein (DUF2141 family)
MKKGFIVTSCILFCCSLFWMSVPMSCANIIPPGGGPKDSIPPQLVSANPHDTTLHFNAKHITFVFDEYVDLQEVQNNLLFSPTFTVNPEVKVRSRTITVTFRDSLESNTTYILNFGNAIKDINEGNVLHNFTYVFSTGAALDSLELTGKVLLAETGAIDTAMVVGLYRKFNDSVILSEKPRYITKLANDGSFHFRNLPSGTFALYAFGDVQNKRYSRNQLFAFSDAPVVIGKSDSLTLYAYREKLAVPTLSGSLPGTQNRGGNTANDRRLRFTASNNNAAQDLKSDYAITFSTPLKFFDSTKISFTTDSTFSKINYSVTLDSTKKILHFKTLWKENTKYNVVLNKDFAADTSGRQLLKSDTLFFTTKKMADYGNLSIRIRSAEAARNPVLQFVQNNIVVFSVSIKNGTYTDKMFTPGEYELRILYDTNGDGAWTPGQFFGTKRQPEIVRPLGSKITVKPNWDNEFER